LTRRGNRPCNIISILTSFHPTIIIRRSENHTHRHFHNTKARVTLNMTATTTARRPPSTVAVGPRAIVLNESPSVTPSGSYSAANSNGVTVNIIGIGESRSFSACCRWRLRRRQKDGRLIRFSVPFRLCFCALSRSRLRGLLLNTSDHHHLSSTHISGSHTPQNFYFSISINEHPPR
jgi:hypothetical protein